MVGVKRALGVLGGALVLAIAPAAAASTTQTYYSQPITTDPYQVVVQNQIVPSPEIDGYVTDMKVDIVEAGNHAKSVPVSQTMLHHVVFGRVGTPDTTCAGRFIKQFDPSQSPLSADLAERFFAVGEEREELHLPAPYGYQIAKTRPNDINDLWFMYVMLMNHRSTKQRVALKYTVTTTTEHRIAVKPVWLDVHNCEADPVFNVPGGGKRGSTFTAHSDWQSPIGGTIVAGGGHLHGGGKAIRVTNRSCHNRLLYRSDPTYQPSKGPNEGAFYRVRPIFHEPGPGHMSYFAQAHPPKPIQIKQGDVLRVNADYDNHFPHLRVMGISIYYIAPDTPGHRVTGCPKPGKQPADPLSHPNKPPRWPTYKFAQGLPTGSFQRATKPRIEIGDLFFNKTRLSVPRNTVLRYSSDGRQVHNVTLGTGPLGFSSPNLAKGGFFKQRLTRKGNYVLFCSLHPALMTQEIRVR